MRSLRQIDSSVHFTEEATLEALGRTLRQARIEAVLETLGVTEQRSRKLSMVLAVLLCIAMSVFTEEAIQDVLAKLLQGPRFLHPEEELEPATAGAICQRRQQLGVAPLVALFHEICKPLATAETVDAFLFGLRLMAVDCTTEDVSDTAVNACYFGRARGSRGAGAFPQLEGAVTSQVRAVYLCECGTHAVVDAGFWPYAVTERVGGLRLLRSVEAGMLVMWDRGFHSYEMCLRARQQQADFLGRLPARIQPQPLRRLCDGSYLAYLMPAKRKGPKPEERLLVRVIDYTIDDPARPGHGEHHRLITSLLSPLAFPAHALACAYHERWEIEITIDETDTHQRRPRQPLRSRTPLGVLQELYGLLLAHYAIRALMHEAALSAHLPPDRLSFVHTLRILRSAFFEFRRSSCEVTVPFGHHFANYRRITEGILVRTLAARHCTPPTSQAHKPL